MDAVAGAADFTFISAFRPELEASTRYWVSVENVSGDFSWTITNDGSTPSGDGTIEDLSRETADGNTTWPVSGTSGDYRRFAVFSLVAGGVDATFTPPTFDTTGLNTIVPLPDGKLLIGGFFTDAGGNVDLDRIARLDADGMVDGTFTPPTGLSNYVYSIAVQEDGKILVGGNFTDVGGDMDRDYLIRLEEDGRLDETFTPPSVNSLVLSILPLADGKILVGGSLSDAGGDENLDRIMRLNANGTVDDTFTPTAINSLVYCMALQDDGKILVGGGMVDVGDEPDRDRIFRLEANGTLDTSFTPPAALSSFVITIVPQLDGKILVGGQFVDVGGDTDLDRLIRLDENGALDGTFAPPTLNGNVNTIVLQADGKILAGGRFSDAGGNTELDYLMRLEEDGTIDPAFDSQVSETGAGLVNCVAVEADGKLLIGGGFSDAGGNTDIRTLFRAEYGGGKRTLTEPRLGQLKWAQVGTSPEPYRVIFEASTNGGTTFRKVGEGTRTTGGWRYSGKNIPAVATIRSRALVRTGNSNGSIRIVEDILSISHTARPTLKLIGNKKIITSRRKVNLRGLAIDADGDVRMVRFKDSRPRGNRFRNTKGTDRWLAKVKLKDRRNKVLVQAFDSRGVRSETLKITVIKR